MIIDNGNDVSVDIDSDEKYSSMSIIYVMNILIQVHTFLKSLLFSHWEQKLYEFISFQLPKNMLFIL